MSAADPRELAGALRYRLDSWPSRYGFAVLAVFLATFLRYLLGGFVGHSVPFILFYPAIAAVTWLAGLWPGIFAVLLSAGIGVYLFFSAGSQAFGLPQTPTGVLLFVVAGVATSGAVALFRRRAARLREFERAVEEVEEMIAVVDRNYRYVIANRAFLNQRGLTRDQVVGHTIAEVLNEPAFSDIVKQKVDESFAGKLVQYEMRYTYPVLGERDLLVCYFPVEGIGGIDRVTAIIQDVTERKQAERELKLFRTLIDQSNDAVEVVDPQTLRFLDVNEKACKDLGYSREELLGMTVFDINPFVEESVRLQVMDKLRVSGSFVGEGVHRRRDGSTFPVETSMRFVTMDRDYVVSVSRDITDRKRAVDELSERDEKFRQVADNIQEIFWMVDTATSQAIYVNPAFERITGRTVESLLDAPHSYREIIHPDDRGRVLNRLSEAATTGSLDEEFRIVRPDGTIRWVEAQGFPVRNPEGQTYRLAGVAQDITARKLAEEARRDSEDRYRDLVEHSQDLLCTHDLAGTLRSVNPEPARILGYSPEELIEQSMRHLIAPEFRGQFDEYLQRIKTLGADRGVMAVLTRTGERRIWEYNNTLRTEGVAVPVVRGMAHDITERKRAEQALKQSEERFRVALKDSPITVFSQDRDLRYTWIYNPRLYWQQEIVGSTDEEILGSDRARALVELKRKAIETGKSVRSELMVPHGDKNHGCDITIEPLFDSTHQLLGVTGVSVDIGRLRELADNLQAAKDRLAQEKLYLQGEIEAELGFEEIIGQDSSLKEVLRAARVVAPTDSTVLLLGETGTGKELAARAIHSLSARREKNFIKLNCAAVPSGLLESELFGHERGAFTSAVTQKVGRLELADKGTLFLDEVGELPLELQPKLLRVLQDLEFERLGGVRTIHVDVRIVSATNRDLKKAVAEKRFREDLFYRLNVFPIHLPTLRERRSDIPMLVWHFVRKHATRMGQHVEMIPASTMEILQNWNWPGNIRELENMVERMVILTKGPVLAPPPVELNTLEDLSDDLTEMEREHIIRVLRETNGILAGEDGAANRLGVKRTTLQSMLKRFNIDLREFRRGPGTYEAE